MKRTKILLLVLSSSVVVTVVYCNLWTTTQKQYLRSRFYYDTNTAATAAAAAATTTTSTTTSTSTSTATATTSLLSSLLSSIKDYFSDVITTNLWLFSNNIGKSGTTTEPSTKRTNNNRRIKTAICLIQKSQLYDLEEWIDYHLLALDFDTIYIYDNSDDYELENYTLPYLPSTKSLIITHLPGYKQQMNAYTKCVEEQKYYDNNNKIQYYHDWLAFWDSDEFLVLKKHSTINELLLDLAYNDNVGNGDNNNNNNNNATTMDNDFDDGFDVDSNQIDGLAFNRIWFYFFNTTNVTTSYYNGLHYNYESGQVLQKFQYRVKQPDPYVKTIAKVSQIKGSHPHYPKYKKNENSYKFHVDTNLEDLSTSQHINKRRPEDVAALYHYETKSLEEYQSKCGRGAATSGTHKLACESIDKIFEFFLYNRTINNGGLIKDDTAWKFLLDKLPNKYNN